MNDYENEMIFFLNNFLTASNNFDLIVSLLNGKKAAVNANKMQLPTKLFKNILTFLSIPYIYYSAFNKIGIIYDEFYNLLFIESN
jgi:hypothetical protein